MITIRQYWLLSIITSCVSALLLWLFLSTPFGLTLVGTAFETNPVLAIHSVSGTLLSGKASLRYQNDNMTLVIDNMAWDWQFWKTIRHLKFAFRSLAAQNIFLSPGKPAGSAPNMQWLSTITIADTAKVDHFILALRRHTVRFADLALQKTGPRDYAFSLTLAETQDSVQGRFIWEDTLHEAHYQITQLTGSFYGNPLSGSALFSVSEKGIQDATIAIAAEENYFRVNYHPRQQEWSWALSLQEVSFIEPLKGTITSEGSVQQNASIEASLHAALEKSPTFSNDLQIDANLSGTLLHHTFSCQATFANLFKVGFSIAGQANLEQSSWEGVFKEGTCTMPSGKNWYQNKPFSLLYDGKNEQLTIEDFCFTEKSSQQYALCGVMNPNLRLESKQFPLEVLNPLLPKPLTLTGFGSGYYKDTVLEARSSQAILQYANTMLPLSDVLFQADFTALHTTLKATLPGQGNVVADFQVEPMPGGNLRNSALTGSLDIIMPKIPNPSTLKNAFWIEGGAKAALSFKGSLLHPIITGHGEIEKLVVPFNLYSSKLVLDKLHFTGASSGLQIAGKGHMGEGPVVVEGNLTLDPELAVKLSLKGDQLTLADTTEYAIEGSPRLTLQLNSAQLNLEGEVSLDKARIAPRKAQGQKRASLDVHIHTPQSDNEEPKPFSHLTGHVRVHFGDNTEYSGYGLNTKVIGKLDIHHNPGQIPVGDGTLQLVNGKYKAFGQTFVLTKGLLHFSHTPLSEPFIDIQAGRQVEERKRSISQKPLLAGLNMHGPIRSPTLRLFSQPSMPEADILSYLILGVPHNQTDAASSQALVQAFTQFAEHVGLDSLQENFILSKVLGVDEFGISQRDNSTSPKTNTIGGKNDKWFSSTALSNTLDNTDVYLGKKISKDLYLYYSYGIADSLNTLRLRYLLGNHFTFEVTSRSQGQGNGADMLWTVDD